MLPSRAHMFMQTRLSRGAGYLLSISGGLMFHLDLVRRWCFLSVGSHAGADPETSMGMRGGDAWETSMGKHGKRAWGVMGAECEIANQIAPNGPTGFVRLEMSWNFW